jgi:cytochrome c oxidase cbb3-type subunit III
MRIHLGVVAAVLVVSAWAQAPDVERGRRLFDSQCALCHGIGGKGGRGPDLTRQKSKTDDAALRSTIRDGIRGTEMPGAWQLSPREIDSVVTYVKSLRFSLAPPETLAGDPRRGERLYEARACGTCHIIRGHGSGFGPELTTIGARRSPAYLREALVNPAAAVPENFVYLEVIAAARPLRGIRLNEDSFSLQLKDSQERFHSFRKAALKQMRRLPDESPMPSYANQLSPAELDDMVAYLASLRGEK